MNLNVGDVEAKTHLANIRRDAAALIGAHHDEIEFAINTSWGLNLAVLGLDWQAGDEVLMPDNEFPSVPYPFKLSNNAASSSNTFRLPIAISPSMK